MTTALANESVWADRAAARSPMVQRSRDRSIQQTTQIVNAAIELIDTKGSTFTVQELAKHAHVALQTFYHHFAGRDELLLAVFEHVLATSMSSFEERGRQLSDPLDRLRFYVTVTVLSLDDETQEASRRFMTAEHYRLHQLFPNELSTANRLYTEMLIPEIVAATELGQLAPNDIEADAWFITELVMATFHHYAFASHSVSTEDLAEGLWQFCLRSLGGSPSGVASAAPARRSTTKKAEATKRSPTGKSQASGAASSPR